MCRLFITCHAKFVFIVAQGLVCRSIPFTGFLKGYGDALREQHGNTPKTDETTIPAHIEVYERLCKYYNAFLSSS